MEVASFYKATGSLAVNGSTPEALSILPSRKGNITAQGGSQQLMADNDVDYFNDEKHYFVKKILSTLTST